MRDNIEKKLKRWLKRKIKVNFGLLISFIITGGLAYSNDGVVNQSVTIKVIDGKIVTIPEGVGVLEGNTWINNGKIDGNDETGVIVDINNQNFNTINNGFISGIIGIKNNEKSKINRIINNGIILGNADIENYLGNGINGVGINFLTNNGIILGKSTSGEQSGNGVIDNSNNLKNDGVISGYNESGKQSGNGLFTIDTITYLTNNGVISGKSTSGGQSGNGILGNVTYLINSGIISGKSTSGEQSGNGIYCNFSQMNSLNNYGIIVGSNKAIYNFDEKTINNYGLLIEGADTKNQIIIAGKDGKVEGNSKFIINGVDNSGNNAKALGINSSDLKNKINEDEDYYDKEFEKYNNLIVNVVGDIDTALNITKIDGYKKSFLFLENSIINGYKTAIKFERNDIGSSFKGTGVIINAGENAFLGSDGADELFLEQDNIKKVKSIVNGNISLGKGNDKLIVQNNTIINGNINMDEGKDEIEFSSSTLNGNIISDNDVIIMDKSYINGNSTLINSSMDLTSVTLNGKINANGGRINIGGNNNLFDVGTTIINGDIVLTNGDIYIKDGAIINGNITLNGNSTTVWLDKNQKINGNVNITAIDKNLGINYSINSDEDMNSLKNQTDKFSGFDVKLSNNVNSNIDLTKLNIKSITGGNSIDIFKSTSDGLNGKMIDGGNGNDILEIISGLFDNTTDNSSINIKNIEELKLANENNRVDIAKLSGVQKILGGSKDDIFNNVNFDILIGINGGKGNDTINMGEGITLNNAKINEIFVTNSIENLNLTGDNQLSLDDLTHIKNINFGMGNNILTLGTQNVGKEFDFTEEKIINGNIKINLNENKAIINSISNGKNIILDKKFINNNGIVILNNGNIKLNLSQNTDFSKGLETILTIDKNGIIGENINFETYAFLKVDENNNILVKDWKELSGEINSTDMDNSIYDNIVKNFNKDGVYGALTKWERDSIVNWIKENGGEVLGDYTFSNTRKQYNNLVSNGTLTIDTDISEILKDFSINNLSGMNVIIKNNTSKGDGTVSFTGETVIMGDIINNSTNNVNLVFAGKTNINNIDNSNSIANTTININDKFSSKNMIFNNKDNKLNINNSSDIENIGVISGNVDITIDSIGENSNGFNKILVGANAGLTVNKDNNYITVNNQTNGLEINTNYGGTLTFNGTDNNIILGNTIGNLVMGSGNDIVNLDTSKFTDDIFVNVDGGNGEDIFNIGSPISTLENNDNNQKLAGKTLTGNINSFETININENINFASDLEITGTDKITIGAGKELGLNIDYTKTQDGKVIGHSLYDKKIEVDNNKGSILIETSTANEDTLISLGNENTASTIINEENVFASESINHNVNYDKNNNVINVTVKKNLELGKNETIKYSHLNDIYKSIVDAGKIKSMAPSSTLIDKTEDEAIKSQLKFYGKIYNSTPYIYSNDVSKETATMINNSIMDSNFRAEKGQWIQYGTLVGRGIEDENSYYGRGYYNKVDKGTLKIDIDSKVYGGYFLREYGITNNTSLGYTIAGNGSDTEIGESKIKGSGYYLGGYAKYSRDNIRLTMGLGYQHNYYNVDRMVSNDYQSMKVEKDYIDNTFTGYVGAKYIQKMENFIIEPYANINLTLVAQSGVSEDDKGDLSLEIENKNFGMIESEIGVNIVKEIPLERGTLNLVGRLGAEIGIKGYEEKSLMAKITGSSKSFEIIKEEKERVKGKASIGIGYETETGMMYNLKGSYLMYSDEKEFNVELGIGYKI